MNSFKLALMLMVLLNSWLN